jgi:hypothetical protein
MQRLTREAAKVKAERLEQFKSQKQLKACPDFTAKDYKSVAVALTCEGERLEGWAKIVQHYLGHVESDRYKVAGEPYRLYPLHREVEVRADGRDPRRKHVTKKILATSFIEAGTVLGLYSGLVCFETTDHLPVLDWRTR